MFFLWIDKPEVWVEQGVVQGGLGEQATLVCRVQGYPIPDIRSIYVQISGLFSSVHIILIFICNFGFIIVR